MAIQICKSFFKTHKKPRNSQNFAMASFSAVISSSRCAVVTQFVGLFVHPHFSFTALGVFSSAKEFQWVFQESLKCVSRMF